MVVNNGCWVVCCKNVLTLFPLIAKNDLDCSRLTTDDSEMIVSVSSLVTDKKESFESGLRATSLCFKFVCVYVGRIIHRLFETGFFILCSFSSLRSLCGRNMLETS